MATWRTGDSEISEVEEVCAGSPQVERWRTAAIPLQHNLYTLCFVFWVLTGIAAFLVTAIAVVTVWVVSSRLGRTEWVAVYDLIAAKEFVLSRLPSDVSDRLGPDAVELLLAWHLDYLRSMGVAAFGRADDLASAAFKVEGERPSAPVKRPPVPAELPSAPAELPSDDSDEDENETPPSAPAELPSDDSDDDKTETPPPELEQVADGALDALLRRAQDAEVEIDAVDMAFVLEETANYLSHIGAVGDEVVS